ncbi:MAG: methyltransferase domain-containing protein [Pseudomonadota bacterium]
MADAKDWTGQLGAKWAEVIEAMDHQLAPAAQPGLAALAAQPGERVIDLGCGGGPTSLEIARSVGSEGAVLGLDISPDLLGIARTRAAGVAQLDFVQGDAASHAFGADRWDALYSRFGCMFFDDPVAAMTHLRAALRPGGRTALTVWAEPQHNPWAMIPANAATEVLGEAEKPAPGAPGPFGWATHEIFMPILDGAGWREIAIEEHDIEMEIGLGTGDPVTRAIELACQIGPMARRLEEHPAAEADLRRVLAPKFASHVRDGSVRLPGRIRVIIARA